MSIHDAHAIDPSTRSPTTSASSTPTPSLDAPGSSFADWLASKHRQSQYDHAWSQLSDRRLYAKAMDVDREWAERHDSFTTVLITLTIRPPAPGDSVAEHADRFWSTPYRRKQRRLLKSHNVWDDHASLSVLAPKLHPDSADGDATAPGAEPGTEPGAEPGTEPGTDVWTHFHQALWLPGTDWSQNDFTGLVELFCSRTPGASRASNPFGQAISVRHHSSDDPSGAPLGQSEADCGNSIGIPASDDAPADRRPTTALPLEIGNNLPLLDVTGGTRDPRSAPTYVQRWAEALWRSPDERGVRRSRTGGLFTQLADARFRARHADLLRAQASPSADASGAPLGQSEPDCGNSIGIPASAEQPVRASAQSAPTHDSDSADALPPVLLSPQANCGNSIGTPRSTADGGLMLLPAVRESLQFVAQAREAGVPPTKLTDALAENDGNWTHAPVPTVIEACF